MNRPLLLWLAALSLALPAAAETTTVTGKQPGPRVHVMIGRMESPETIGIHRQLAALTLTKGSLVLESDADLPADIPATASGADLSVQFHWTRGVKNGNPPLPALEHTADLAASAWFATAVGDSVTAGRLAEHQVRQMPDAKGFARLSFIPPGDAAVRSRQQRIARRFVIEALRSLGMADHPEGVWPAGIDRSKLICLYDAEGCGSIGSIRLERVINRTTLGHQVAFVCGEDIREGALDGTAAVVFPGGSAGGITRALTPDGVGRVTRFVENGGAFLGVCAGAYFSGSGSPKYACLTHLKQHQPWAKGQKVLDMQLTPQGIEILGEEFKTFRNRYNNGPVFPDLTDPQPGSRHQPVINLAVFKEASVKNGISQDVMLDTSAILATTFGKGRVMSISPHPETHEELDVLVGRCFGWTLGLSREAVQRRADAPPPDPQSAASPAPERIRESTRQGPVAGPALRVLVGRTEREKVIGLDEQVAALPPTRGSLQVETYRAATPTAVSADSALTLRFEWRSSSDADKAVLPSLSASDPARTRAWFLQAAGESYKEEDLTALRIAKSSAPNSISLSFPAPRSGLAKSRQIRVARRLVMAAMEYHEMLSGPLEGTWPAGFPESRTLLNYDAEGVGYGGSTLLDRVVNETTLDVRILPVCPEDLREGALQHADGVLFPGGSGRGIARALRPEGVEQVRRFVERGGAYFGVCAGAFFATSGIDEYACMVPLQHHQPWAKGRANLQVNLTEAGRKVLGEEFATFETNYNNGPVFDQVPADAAITILATFATAAGREGAKHEVMVGTPAIFSTTYGKGRIMTISPHPEGRPKTYPLVARSIGWALGLPTEDIHARSVP